MDTAVRLGTFTPSVLLAVARRRGRLAEAGLAVQELPVASSPAQFRALLSGELDVGLTSPDNVVAYRFVPDNPLGGTVDVRIVDAVDRGMGLALYGRPGLPGPEGLRGARIGVDVPTSGFALALYALTDRLGIDRDAYQLVPLGATPRRLEALLDGRCDATMLNAGNELAAEDAGSPLLGRVREVCHPYLGTVVAVAGVERLVVARRLAAALRRTAADIRGGAADDQVRAEAKRLLDLDDGQASRYLARLTDPDEGLVADEGVDRAALGAMVGLRRRYLPARAGGVDPLDHALDPDAGLVADADPA